MRSLMMEITERLRHATAVGVIATLTFGTLGTLPVAAKEKPIDAIVQVPVAGTTATVERSREPRQLPGSPWTVRTSSP